MSADASHSTQPDYQDPGSKPGRAPMPIWLFILFALLFYWGMLYIDDHGGGFSQTVYWPYGDAAALEDAQPPPDPVVAMKRLGELTFTRTAQCVACHGANGMGTGNGCPPLVASEWVTGGGPNRLIRLVLNGGAGPITVKGEAFPGTTQMLAFKDMLNDEQIAAVLTFVRSEWGNKADPVTAAQVKAIREKTKDKSGTWSPSDLLKIPDKD